MAKEAKFTLGGRNYTVLALPIGKSKMWRDKLAIPFGRLAHVLTQAGMVEINQFGDIAGVVQQFSGILLGSMDMMLNLLFEYSEELAKDREWIEENAYDEEALHAFGEVLKLAFPFGVMLEVVTGRLGSKTSSNSLSRNGVSPLPASGPPKKEKSKR